MPKMMTSAIAIMALSLGLPAVAADEAPAMDPLAQAKEAVSDVVKPVERWAGQKPEETAESGVTEEGSAMEDAASTADDAATESEAAMEGAATTVDEATAESEAAMDGESTMESDAAMDGAATAEGETAMDGEVAAESEHSMDAEAAAESEAAMDGEAAMEGEQGAEAGMAEGDAAGGEIGTQTATGDGPSDEVDWSQHIGKSVISPDGTELGEISEVAVGPDGQTMVVIAHGGFMGLGKKQYAVMPEALTVQGDQVSASMTLDQVAEMPEYEQSQPTE